MHAFTSINTFYACTAINKCSSQDTFWWFQFNRFVDLSVCVFVSLLIQLNPRAQMYLDHDGNRIVLLVSFQWRNQFSESLAQM